MKTVWRPSSTLEITGGMRHMFCSDLFEHR